MTKVGLILIAAALAACSDEPPIRIDGSSQPKFEASASAARRQLPIADRIVFDRAIRAVGGRRHAARDTEALARVTFDGMTAAEIVADQQAREQ